MKRKILITVAEHSADMHAGKFVESLLELTRDVEVHALGGPGLRAAGAIVHHDTVSNAAMGLRAFGRYREVKRLLRWADDFIKSERIDLQVCCDSWTLNSHFAQLAKSQGLPVLYYIAPQAWASREGRVKKLAKIADRLACILPFEEKFFRDRGVNATFVGHPLFDQMTPAHQSSGSTSMQSDLQAQSARDQIETYVNESTRAFRVALPCGSRRSIARANLPRQLQVARLIRQQFPRASFVIPATDITRDVVTATVSSKAGIEIVMNDFDQALAGCDLAITVSGTATLHVAAHGVPMIIVYSGSRALWHLAGRWMIRTRTFGLVNLLANDGIDDVTKHVCPEFVPWNGTVDAVANCAIDLLQHPDKLEAQRRRLNALIATIGQPGASTRVAQMAIDLLGGKS